MTAFNFVDHDPRVRYARDPRLIADFADALRANPGRWAEFPVPGRTVRAGRMLASRINNSQIGCPKALMGNEFESTFRDGIVYVRYLLDARC